LISNAKSIIFEECGHFMAIDKPEDVTKTITTFYDEHIIKKDQKLNELT
jgi:hypothetical protein